MVNTVASNSASDIRTDYMTLLITQLQNQNPLEPMTNDQMSMQLAQFSQLEQLENVNNNFDQVLSTMDQAYAKELLGKEISFTSDSEDESDLLLTGTVDQVNQTESDIQLLVGNRTIGLADVLSVRNP
ncbi:flagellar hook capping FlgD N-terminal domain-containing protein [Planctomycetota bacterium]